MAYKLKKPYSDAERTSFLIEYQSNQKLQITEGSDVYTTTKDYQEVTFKADYMFALAANEIMAEAEVEIDVPTVTTDTITVPVVDPFTGETTYVEQEITTPVTKVIEVEIIDPETGETTTQEVTVQEYHKETVTVNKPIIDPDYEQHQAEKEQAKINKLSLTKADFWIALLDRNITKADVKEKVALIPDATLRAKTLIRIDDADHFWRGDASMDILGAMFNLTSADLNYLFQNKKLPEVE